MPPIEQRAARLGAVLKLLGGHPVLSPDEALRYAQQHLTGRT